MQAQRVGYLWWSTNTQIISIPVTPAGFRAEVSALREELEKALTEIAQLKQAKDTAVTNEISSLVMLVHITDFCSFLLDPLQLCKMVT